MAENLLGFFEVLIDWEKKARSEKNEGPSKRSPLETPSQDK